MMSVKFYFNLRFELSVKIPFMLLCADQISLPDDCWPQWGLFSTRMRTPIDPLSYNMLSVFNTMVKSVPYFCQKFD